MAVVVVAVMEAAAATTTKGSADGRVALSANKEAIVAKSTRLSSPSSPPSNESNSFH